MGGERGEWRKLCGRAEAGEQKKRKKREPRSAAQATKRVERLGCLAQL
jgi:hypothetical protein